MNKQRNDPIEEDYKNYKVVYEEVDKTKKLREVLEGSIVYEFPTLYVVIN